MRTARLIFLTIFAAAFFTIHVENVSAEAIENDAVEESIIEGVTVNTEVEIAVLPDQAYHEWLLGGRKTDSYRDFPKRGILLWRLR